jgi:1,4-dihydroxy-2-naphthoate octaprenyltransferase
MPSSQVLEREPKAASRVASEAVGSPSPLRIWVLAARPRTLTASIAPVLVGTAFAASQQTISALTFLAALFGSLFIQVGANLANDYSDARRGADTEDRLGPLRVTAGGLVPPHQVLVATWIAFGAAALVGSYLVAVAGWELLIVGIVSILAGITYVGGPRPYGYIGLGEVFVFLFYGIVAVAGSYYVQTQVLRWEAVALAVPVGLIACAILMVNNIRDIDTDRRSGKKTLAVRLGRERSRRLYAFTLAGAFLGVSVMAGVLESAWLLLPILTIPLAVGLSRTIFNHTDGPALNGALAKTGMLKLVFCVLLSVGLLLST